MSNDSIQRLSTFDTALSAEHYQTFEMAKANDGILGGDDIAQIRSYAAYARAQAQAIHKTIAATSGIEDVAAIKAEATETAQTFARVGIYADQRIGELLRELPTKQGQRSDLTSLPTGNEVTKGEALDAAGFTPKTAAQLEALAANPEVVEQVIQQAEQDGRIPSRAQVLKAIREREEAERKLEQAQQEIEALERQNDQLYEQASQATAPRVVTREVTREVVPEDVERQIDSLTHERDLYISDLQKLRSQLEEKSRELEKARSILGMSQHVQDIRSDVHYLITATNQYIRQYGGLTWTVQQLSQVDEPTIEELRKAVTNLATFSGALYASLEEM